MSSAPYKISVITVVYNAAALLEQTINSVLRQTYPSVEYVIIDGASTDGTLQVIEKYKSRIHQLISEKDKGIYDAMNKGLRVATGDYVLFLNAGDLFYDDDVLNNIFTKNPPADVYYGNTKVIDAGGHEVADRRLLPPNQLNWKSFRLGMSVSHQSFIAKRSLCPLYDLNYKIAADIDWVIRILRKSDNIINTRQYISKFLEGGTSAKTRSKALKERFAIMAHHYGLFTTLCCHVFIMLRYPLHRFMKKSMT